MMKVKKTGVKIFIIIVIAYILFGLFLYFNQRTMIYYPDGQDFYGCEGFKDYQKEEFNGTRFYLKQGEDDKVIIYYHGNAGSACDRSKIRSIFESSDASLLFVEYAGYSDDDVMPSRDLILKDVENIQRYIKERSFEKLIVYGQSIGSGAAGYHAYLGDVDGLILVSPFSRLEDVAQSRYIFYPTSMILRERYDNVAWLEGYEGSLMIIHGDDDKVVPKRFSQELFQQVQTDEKDRVLIEGRGHNDMWSSSRFKDAIVEFLDKMQD